MDGTIYTYTHLTNNLPSSILPGVNSDWSPLSQYGWFGKHPQNLPYKMESEGNPDTKFVYNYRMENGLISFSTCTHSNHGHFVKKTPHIMNGNRAASTVPPHTTFDGQATARAGVDRRTFYLTI